MNLKLRINTPKLKKIEIPLIMRGYQSAVTASLRKEPKPVVVLPKSAVFSGYGYSLCGCEGTLSDLMAGKADCLKQLNVEDEVTP